MQVVIGAETLPGKRQITNQPCGPKPYPQRVRCHLGAVAPPKDLHAWADRSCYGPSCWNPQRSADHPVQHCPRARAVVCRAKVKGPTIRYVCRECGASESKEYGRCPSCKKYGTYDAEEVNAPVSTGGGVGISAMQRATSAVKQLRTKSTPAVSNGTGYSDDEPDYYTDLAAGAAKAQPTNRSWVSNTRVGAAPISLRDMSNKSLTARSPGRMVLTGRTGQEINRVLGGGVVSGSLVLVGGEPGVGKSTLSLQIAAMIAQPDLDYDALSETDEQKDGLSGLGNNAGESAGRDLIVMPEAQPVAPQTAGNVGSKAKRRQGSQASATPSPGSGSSPEPVSISQHEIPQSNRTNVSGSPEANGTHLQGAGPPATTRAVLYVSGEETCDQVYDRALRMGLQNCDTLHVLAECRMEVILRQTLLMRPAALVVDSLQTLFLSDLDNVSGAVVQLKECTSALLRLAKDHGITVFAIGHVTKTSDLAGPKAMEHMVDAVLKLEGDMSQSYRVLRAGKNRFGTTDEVGVFCMDVGGLHAVNNPSSMFLANRSSGSSAVAVILDGTRVLVLEVQALVTACYPGSKSPPVRQSSGAPKDRVFAIIINVLHKFVARMSNQNVVVNVTGGMQMREPAADLAIAVAIASSYYNLPVPKDIAAIGEIDLGGGLRPVRCLDMRLIELAKLGLKSIVIPNVPEATKLQRDPRLAGVTLHPCDTLLQALQVVLGPEVGVRKGKGRSKSKQAADDEDMEEEEEEEEED